MLKELDPLLHSQLRLAVISILMSVDEADFVYLKEKTEATAGNLSVQIDKLSNAGYIQVKKRICRQENPHLLPHYRTRQRSIEKYVDAVRSYINI